MARRGENIYKRKDGRWEGRIALKPSASGKRRYLSVYGKTYKEVKEKLRLVRIGLSLNGKAGIITLEEAVDIWMKDKEKYWKPTTYAAYQHALEKYAIPWLGDMKISSIDNRMLEDFASTLIEQRGNTLSLNYLSYICDVIIRALKHARKRHGYATQPLDNPIAKNKKCQIIPPGEQTLAVLEKHLIAGAETDKNLGVLVAFYTGIRIGELCALTWEDMDLTEGLMYVRKNVQRVRRPEEGKKKDGGKSKTYTVIQTPKTSDSIRAVPIPPILLPILRRHRKEDSCHIIQGTKNPWADPRTVQNHFKKTLENCGLEHFNFHMLRHAFASKCIAMGFDIKSLSEILGHSDIRVTMELYVHSSVQLKKQLMNRFDSYFYPEKKKIF